MRKKRQEMQEEWLTTDVSGGGIQGTYRRWTETSQKRNWRNGQRNKTYRIHGDGFLGVIPGWWLQDDDCLDQEHREKGTTNLGWSDIAAFVILEAEGRKRDWGIWEGWLILIIHVSNSCFIIWVFGFNESEGFRGWILIVHFLTSFSYL